MDRLFAITSSPSSGTAAAASPPEPQALAEIEPARLEAFHDGLPRWYAEHRRDLPWRTTRDPYAILVAEMMLQQTQAARVEPRYRAWLARFPTLSALAAAPTADVLREWSGLGYNARAVRLQAIARQIVTQGLDGLPSAVDALRALPGIGDYTAHAIACFAFGQHVAVVDTNVKRVLHRVLVGPEPLQTRPRDVWALARGALPSGSAYDWNQALMDFGAAVCTARRPACASCVLRPVCRAAPVIHSALAARGRGGSSRSERAVPFSASSRYFRGKILRVLGQLKRGQRLDLGTLGAEIKPDYTALDRPWLDRLVAALARDGLVTVSANAGSDSPAGLSRSRSTAGGEQATLHETGELYRFDAATEVSAHDLEARRVFVSLREG